MSDPHLFYTIRAEGDLHLSPFLLDKFLKFELGANPREVKSTKHGYSIEITEKQAEKISGKKVGEATIVAELHPFKNIKKGVIYYPEFNYIPINEILHELKTEKVTDITRILRKGTAKRHELENLPEKGLTNTGKFIVTFQAKSLPKRLKVGLEMVPVDLYYANPLQCKKCLNFGHITLKCTEALSNCGKCSEQHEEKDCQSNLLKCRNCGECHHAKSRLCSVFKQEANIIKYATDHNMPRHEAKKILSPSDSISFAQVTKSQPQTTMPNTSQRNIEELLTKVLQQQNMLMNLILTGKVTGITDQSTSKKQPAQEHLMAFQEKIRNEEKTKRGHSPETLVNNVKQHKANSINNLDLEHDYSLDIQEMEVIENEETYTLAEPAVPVYPVTSAKTTSTSTTTTRPRQSAENDKYTSSNNRRKTKQHPKQTTSEEDDL